MTWRHLKADGVEWDVRIASGVTEGVDPTVTDILEFRPAGGEPLPPRRVAIEAGSLPDMTDVELLAAYRRARPIGGDHYGRPGKTMPDMR
jgi:hypothetical protein